MAVAEDESLGFRVQGLGFRIQVLGLEFYDSGSRVAISDNHGLRKKNCMGY